MNMFQKRGLTVLCVYLNLKYFLNDYWKLAEKIFIHVKVKHARDKRAGNTLPIFNNCFGV